jgi:hypothetical protein
MDQAAIDQLVYWCGYVFLIGFAVGTIVKLLVGKID